MKNKILLIIGSVLLVLLTSYFVIAYINFNRISKDLDPILMSCEVKSEDENAKVTICRTFLYRIEKEETKNDSIKLNLRLWFIGEE